MSAFRRRQSALCPRQWAQLWAAVAHRDTAVAAPQAARRPQPGAAQMRAMLVGWMGAVLEGASAGPCRPAACLQNPLPQGCACQDNHAVAAVMASSLLCRSARPRFQVSAVPARNPSGSSLPPLLPAGHGRPTGSPTPHLACAAAHSSNWLPSHSAKLPCLPRALGPSSTWARVSLLPLLRTPAA